MHPVRQQLARDPLFALGVALAILVIVAGLAAPLLAPADPITGDLRTAYLLKPSLHHLFGTDSQGRDVLSRVLYGA
ncbi:MAG: hypothetical protein ACREL4_02255, partial [Gemmatimonadales bacterium]